MTQRPASVADLRPVDLFAELSDDELAAWAVATTVWDAAPGDVIAEQGESPAGLYFLLHGSIRSLVMEGDRIEPVGRQESPTWMGAIAVLTEGPLGVRMQVEEPAVVGMLPAEQFEPLVLAHPTVHRRIMRQIAPVMSRITAIEQNRERLASLGTMAAGLAHELNNPAAAAKRAASDLVEALEVVGGAIGAFIDSGVERVDAAELLRLQRAALQNASERTALDALDAADEEERLLEQLEELGIAEPWKIAEPLAAAGVDAAWLAEVRDHAGPATEAAVRWVAASLTARSLGEELRESAERMSRLVGAVKTYAYMDRGGVVEADIHDGIETTLVVLGHKLKHTQIEVLRDYDRTLPQITMRGSELNQVWTNLLDNAIDALGGDGTITIVTRRDGPCIRVSFTDDGPGIAPEARPHIFDPFFTTKDVGQGTGLGLDTARRIVVDRHDGSIAVDSEPGRTTFDVWLPFTTP